ncbi:hypothetical protein LTR10_000651 [Elasticomyces elasticus]|nr:hypothetical protein LTR10_000651 [Elasticomyces elasticus]KAK4980101.1 hypothetical protein LTR42_000408 [Elasticomyces elasticus]
MADAADKMIGTVVINALKDVDEVDGFAWDQYSTVERPSAMCWNILAKDNRPGKGTSRPDTE